MRALQRVMLLVAVSLAAGCAGGEYGAELRRMPKPQLLTDTNASQMELPSSAPFSITLAESQQKRELDGVAKAEAVAEKTGSGVATAQVKGGGIATADFQVGHAFQNRTERQLQLDIEAMLRVKFDARGETEDPLPLAKAYATLYARNTKNRTLAKFDLVDHTSDKGNGGGSRSETLTFPIVLGPGETANVYVAGHVQIDAENGHTASGSVTLEELTMRVKSSPAPAIQAAGDGG